MCQCRVHGGRLLYTNPESQYFPFSIKRCEIALFLRHHQGLHQRGSLLPERKTCAVGGQSSKSPSSYPLCGMGALSRAKATSESTFAWRAQVRKMKESDGSDGSRMAGSTLPSELSSRHVEHGVLEGPHEEDARHPPYSRQNRIPRNISLVSDPHERFSAHLRESSSCRHSL